MGSLALLVVASVIGGLALLLRRREPDHMDDLTQAWRVDHRRRAWNEGEPRMNVVIKGKFHEPLRDRSRYTARVRNGRR